MVSGISPWLYLPSTPCSSCMLFPFYQWPFQIPKLELLYIPLHRPYIDLVYMYIYIYVFHTWVHICIYIYICIQMYIYVYLFIYIYTYSYGRYLQFGMAMGLCHPLSPWTVIQGAPSPPRAPSPSVAASRANLSHLGEKTPTVDSCGTWPSYSDSWFGWFTYWFTKWKKTNKLPSGYD